MKIYAVNEIMDLKWPEDHKELYVGFFSTREKAEAYVAKQREENKDDPCYDFDYDIEEWELDREY